MLLQLARACLLRALAAKIWLRALIASIFEQARPKR